MSLPKEDKCHMAILTDIYDDAIEGTPCPNQK
jgi:hypothetical protein